MQITSYLDKTEAQISELISELAKASDRVCLQILRAPIGGVVTPAQPLLAVVPYQAGLVVDAMVKNARLVWSILGRPPISRSRPSTSPAYKYGVMSCVHIFFRPLRATERCCYGTTLPFEM